MIVDAHHHLWDPARRDYPWMAGAVLDPIRRRYTVDDLQAVAGPSVTATVLVQTVSDVAETEEFLATASASDGLIAGVVGWADLTEADISSVLDRLRIVPGGQSLIGVRHQVEDESDPEWLLRHDVLHGLRAVGAAGLVYDLLVREPHRDAAYSAAGRLPDTSFVLDHAGKPAIAQNEWASWASWIERLAGLPNVACKLSGLITEAAWDGWSATTLQPYAEHILAAFGADRVMFGSDWPVCELAGSYPEVLTLTKTLLSGASEAERTAVLGATAQRVYNLPT